uniref:CSON002931 protein n=1 Tax=Culicoides sonorensis TaxID=179676 RepID=A0A336K1N3_CULSO
MAPRVNNKKVKNEEDKSMNENSNELSDDASNTGFGSYLRSEQGMNYMKIFVMMNTLVMLLTMGLPAMKQAYEILQDWLKEWIVM